MCLFARFKVKQKSWKSGVAGNMASGNMANGFMENSQNIVLKAKKSFKFKKIRLN